MKRKITLFSVLMMAASVTTAQNGQGQYTFGTPQPALEKQGETQYVVKPVTIVNQQVYQKTLNELFFEDFSTGYVAGGGGIMFSTDNGDYVTDGPNSNYWSTSTAATVAGTTMGMNSRYLLWNSTSITGETPNYASTPVNGAVRTPSMDLSTVTNAEYVLTFNTASEYCCHPLLFPWTINASTDGGVTFSAMPIMLDFGVPRQVSTTALATPLAYSVDISSLLNANPALNDDVVIEFRWVGDNIFEYTSGAFQYNTFSFWGLDNVSIFEKPDYEVSLDMAWTGDIILDFEKSEIPVSLAGEFVAQAKLSNNGRNLPSGVALKVSIMDGMTEVATATGGTLLNNFATTADTITFNTGIDLATLGVGNYSVVFEVEMNELDAVMTNNTAMRTVKITQNTYASFNAELPRSGESPGFFYSGAPQTTSSEMQFGNLYTFDENVTVHGVELAGHAGYSPPYGTTLNEELSIFIYREGASAYEYHAGPFTYQVTSAKLGNAQSRYLYNLHQPEVNSQSGEVVLLAGEIYLVVFQHYGGAGTHFFYWGTPFDHDLSARMEGPFGAGGASSWFLLDEEPIMALNIDQSLNLSENEILTSSVSLYPNPASDNATIVFSLNTESTVSIEVRDLAGKLVYSSTEGKLTAGSHNKTISTATLADGMYTYTLVANGAQVTNKFVVKK